MDNVFLLRSDQTPHLECSIIPFNVLSSYFFHHEASAVGDSYKTFCPVLKFKVDHLKFVDVEFHLLDLPPHVESSSTQLTISSTLGLMANFDLHLSFPHQYNITTSESSILYIP